MAINKKLIHFKNKLTFELEVAKGNILNTSIVFIQDSKEIYTHGTLYDGKSVDLSNIESSIQSILEELGLDELNAILVDTGDAAFDPVINDYVSSIELLNTLTNYATKTEIPTKVSQLTNDSNFTSNTGTITGITMNGTSKGSSGIVDLGTVITSHQDISGKQDKLVSGTNIKSINGTSLLGSGDVEIDALSEIPIVEHGAEVTSFALTPNVFHKWGTVSSLSLTLTTPSDSTILSEYVFQFTSGSTATSLTLPSTVKWTSELTIEPNKTYQVSIIDNLGVIGGF